MIILASKSPRRKELLSLIIEDFMIIPSDIDESKYPLEELSFEKGKKISSLYPNDIIISADTFVSLNNEILNKPKDEKEAYLMLKKLSNNTHLVTTYFSIIYQNKNFIYTDKVVTEVVFNDLSDDLINTYIATKSPLDKAGGYGIQDNFPLVKKYIGSKDNVIGFPLKEIKQILIKLGVKTK